MKFFKKNKKPDNYELVIQSSSKLDKALERMNESSKELAETISQSLTDYAKKLEHMFNIINDSMVVTNNSGSIHSVNHKSSELFNCDKFSLLNTNIIDLFNISSFDEFLFNCEKSFQLTYGDKILEITMSTFKDSDDMLYYIFMIKDITHIFHQKEELEKLYQKNTDLYSIINNSKTSVVLIQEIDGKLIIVFANDGFEHISSKSKEELVNSPLFDIIGNNDKAIWEIKRSMNRKITNTHEIKLFDKWFNVQITPDNNKWMLIFYDINDLKIAYDELTKSEEHFKLLSETSDESMFIHNGESLLTWNDNLLKLLGYSELELHEINPVDLVTLLEREKFREKLFSKKTETYDTVFSNKHGHNIDVSINSNPITYNDITARIVLAKDVSKYKNLIYQHDTLNERYNNITENTIDMIVCYDADFNITYSNNTFKEYYGVSEYSLDGFSILDIIPNSDEEKFKSHLNSLSKENNIKRSINRVNYHNEMRIHDWIDKAIFNKKGVFLEYQSIIRDVSYIFKEKNNLISMFDKKNAES